MASDTQVALSRIQRGGSTGMSRATRQAVAPFLQKLYEMVSDSATDNLIRWSDSGDSFFVIDHERVAHDVLPRWFKHSNFASFVRQLNMYGFHKIPHLQQGVLKSDTETELWNFEHPNFHRGQPDLLCLISRKKQATDRPNEDVSVETREANSFPATTVNGQMVDVNNIVNGIAAIKRHQSAISADLNDLKTSNQHLWQEALAARERHNKHQDTINKILKFLASVFGNNGSPHKASPGGSSPHPSIPRRRQQLLIEDGSSSKKGADIDHAEFDLDALDTVHSTPTTRFTTLDTPTTIPATPHVFSQAPDLETPVSTAAPRIVDATSESPPPQAVNSQHNVVDDAPNLNSMSTDLSQNMLAPISQNPANSTDSVFQAILNSPQQLQKILGMLNMQQGFSPSPPFPPFEVPQPPPQTNAAPTSDHPMFSHPPISSVPSSGDLIEPLDDSSNYLSLLRNDDNANFGPILDNSSKLHKSYKDASDINADVDALQSSIDALIENLGLNPEGFNEANANVNQILPDEDPVLKRHAPNFSDNTAQDGTSHHDLEGSSSSIPDFDVEAFIRELNHQQQGSSDVSAIETNALDGNSNTNAYSDRLSAYVDEINSQSDTSSPGMTRVSLDENPSDVNSRKKHSKRKSEVAEISPETETLPRPKRKR